MKLSPIEYESLVRIKERCRPLPSPEVLVTLKRKGLIEYYLEKQDVFICILLSLQALENVCC